MGNKQQCVCGHGKGDHAKKQRDYNTRLMECDDINCNCKEYEFEKNIHVPKRQFELTDRNKIIRKTFFMSRLNDKGYPQ